MNPKQTVTPASPAIKLTDVYYILFRHKWMILGLSALSITAACVTFSYMQMPYKSVAQLYISSVTTGTTPGAVKQDEVNLSSSVAAILNTEVVILSSLNLATKTADLVGPAKILDLVGRGAEMTNEAGIEIQKNFEAATLPGTQVIQLVYTHPRQEVVKQVMDTMISQYLDTHKKLHEHLHAYDETLAEETTKRQNRLNKIDDELAQLKKTNDIVDIKEEMQVFANHEEDVRKELGKAQRDLAYAKVNVEELEKKMAGTSPAGPAKPASTNALETNAAAPSAAAIKEYTKLNKTIQNLQDLAEQYDKRGLSTNTAVVQTNTLELAAAQSTKEKMEQDFPALINVAPVTPSEGNAKRSTGESLADELEKWNRTRKGLEAQITLETNELELLSSQGANLNKVDEKMKELQRDEAMADKEFTEIYTEKAKQELEETFRDLGGANIQVIESPTPPVRDLKKVSKVVLGIAASGIILGLALACVWELVLDRSLRRPQEVMSRLKLPYFITIPKLKGKKSRGAFNWNTAPKMLTAGGNGPAPAPGSESKALIPAQNGALAPWDERHEMRPFHETLRDRLVSYFEMINLTHKPKLVAVTSCGARAGVSTVASGLASSLSETGDGNVLLVDMNSENGEAHHFFKGELAMGLDDILEKQKANRQDALVQDNLYVVKEHSNGDKLPSVLPKRFSHLVSKLKASDYDYIILDMPPVTEISVTPRLAKFMDMVLLVVEAEKTNQDAAQRAATLLTESRANVGVVMNKCQSYVPARLCHEA